MELLRQDGSPYINDLDFHSPSPSSAQLNISPNSFDTFDFNRPSFPHTPSYNGSYQNSPYSGHSELSYVGDGNDFNLFDDQPSGVQNPEDYDPSEYDPPNSTGLLMFDGDFMTNLNNQNPHVSVSVTPADVDENSPHSYDYSSPSSNGGGDSGAEGGPRSRASSVSSNPRVPSASSHLDVTTQGFENMRFDSPNWGTNPLPDRPLSPLQKPQSPPQLLIPDSTSPSTAMFPQSTPIINAPSGDGGVMGSGPQLHVVPATPVSGGGGTSQPIPFQHRLETLHQGSSQNGQQVSSSWNHQSQQAPRPEESPLAVPQYREQTQLPFTFPPHSHDPTSGGLSTSGSQLNTTNGHNFLFPIPPRSRSKSDTSLQPPQWNTDFMSQDHLAHDDGSALDDSGTVNMNDVLPSSGTMSHPGSAGAHQASFGTAPQQPPNLSHGYTFGPPGSPSHPYVTTNDFLSPDLGATLRRSKSDSNSRPGHHRQSRSEDMRHSTTHLYPPSSQQEFITRQYLHPQEPIPAIRSHVRRASSGSRADRLGLNGSWSNSSSARPSPYPSPSASPRFRNDELPNVALSGRHAPLLQADMDPGLILPQEQTQGGVNVSKPNVTTGRTADASHRRRKQDANFTCPVPGCGSTFTRSFNLKGHLRSHNEEKPFQCKWPGCGKGFARQHDCKRHEQLHSNYRPFTCDGCNKTFARMDALNRHLRSEGGAECQRLLTETGNTRNGRSPSSVPKAESDAGWPGMSVMV